MVDDNIQRYYRALNLEPTASPQEIYQAYRDLVRVWEPARFAHSPRLELMAEEKLKEIIEAYRALLPGGAPEGSSAASEPEAAAPLPPDPFAAPEAAAPVADRYRLHDTQVDMPPLPQTPPQSAVAVVDPLPEASQIADRYRLHDTQVDLPPLPKPEPPPPVVVAVPPAAQAAAPAAPAPPPAAQPPAAQPPAAQPPAAQPPAGQPVEPLVAATLPAATPPRSNKLRIAMGAVTLALVAGLAIFLYLALTGPPPSRVPEPPAAAATQPAAGQPVTEEAAPAPVAVPGVVESAPAAPVPPRRVARRRAPQPEPPPLQLANGTELMTPLGRRGVGKFHIANQSGQDAVARISTQSAPETALRLVYIKSGGEVDITGIGTGVYFVSFSIGPVTNKPRSFGPRNGPFQFLQIDTVSGTQSDQYQIVLKPRQ
ncbi:MAG: J domain-containing protein [Acidobacteriota bacterium]